MSVVQNKDIEMAVATPVAAAVVPGVVVSAPVAIGGVVEIR